jgi:D-methionine transport system substrate-binding protein
LEVFVKKTILRLLIAGIVVIALAQPVVAKGTKDKIGKANVLRVGVNPVPHAELLELVKPDLAAAGIELEIVVFTDYVAPNTTLISGDLDANFFQTVPYLESNDDWKAKLAYLYDVHIEPLGFYSKKIKSISELPSGATIAIPNDPANGGRSLILFEKNGLLTLAPNSGIRPTVKDIVANPKNLKFRELEAAQLPRTLDDVDASIINGNYAIESGFSPATDSILLESGVNSPYANGLVVVKGHENDPRLQALKIVLQSQKVKDFINANYKGGVLAAF